MHVGFWVENGKSLILSRFLALADDDSLDDSLEKLAADILRVISELRVVSELHVVCELLVVSELRGEEKTAVTGPGEGDEQSGIRTRQHRKHRTLPASPAPQPSEVHR
jgi:hypothetical protein